MHSRNELDDLAFPLELNDHKLILVQAAKSGKYPPNNWLQPDGKKQDKKNQYNSIMHHITAHLRGELVDAESGLDHRLHAAIRLMMDYTRSKRNVIHPDDQKQHDELIKKELDKALKAQYEVNKTKLDFTSGNEMRNVIYTNFNDSSYE